MKLNFFFDFSWNLKNRTLRFFCKNLFKCKIKKFHPSLLIDYVALVACKFQNILLYWALKKKSLFVLKLLVIHEIARCVTLGIWRPSTNSFKTKTINRRNPNFALSGWYNVAVHVPWKSSPQYYQVAKKKKMRTYFWNGPRNSSIHPVCDLFLNCRKGTS